jgi:hypothetical protein
MLRILAIDFGALAAVGAALGGVAVATATVAAVRRYRRWSDPGARPVRAARSNAALAATIAAFGLIALSLALCTSTG